MRIDPKRLMDLRLLMALIGSLAITGSAGPSIMDQILRQGKLVVITRNSPTTYFEDNIGNTGYEFELASAFARFLGVDLVIKQADDLDSLYSAVENKQVALAAAGLTIDPDFSRQIRFSTPYMQVVQQVIYRRGGMKPMTTPDLARGQLVVTSDSEPALRLHRLQDTETPELTWSESPDFEAVELLKMVSTGEADFTIVNSNEFDTLQAYYPNLSVAFDLSGALPMAWAFPTGQDNSLYLAAQNFFHNAQGNGQLLAITERFYGHLEQLNSAGARIFQRQTDKSLEKYDDMFQLAAQKYQLDWRLLAAIGYQESHWNPKARSFTGVRGMMMLTRRTAKELGVKNRLDAKQSIEGGASYLAKLIRRIPENTQQPDRTWMALAAYNVGYGHLTDAQQLTRLNGGDPSLWMDVKDYLPLLSQKRYYKDTKHGYARGNEPVKYVQNIRRYYDILVWNDQPDLDLSFESENLKLSAKVSVVPPRI